MVAAIGWRCIGHKRAYILAKHLYLIALGSNRRHAQLGSPRKIVAKAIELIDGSFGKVKAASPVIESRPLGPSRRRYANAAIVLKSKLGPRKMLDCLMAMEAMLGRERRGQRWGARVIDLDIVLWSGGIFAKPGLLVPHPRFRERGFVLGPAAQIVSKWRDPLTGLTLAQLHARLTRPRPVPR
mgnify:CR=1 FL=1